MHNRGNCCSQQPPAWFVSDPAVTRVTPMPCHLPAAGCDAVLLAGRALTRGLQPQVAAPAVLPQEAARAAAGSGCPTALGAEVRNFGGVQESPMPIFSGSQRWPCPMPGTQSNGFLGFLSESFFLKVIPTVNN